MRLIRRVAATLAMAVIAAVGVRLGGKGGTPRQHGGWKPIDLDSYEMQPSADRVSAGHTGGANDAISVTEMHIVARPDDVPAAAVVTG